MKIGIYNELTVHSLGGAEYAVAVLAEDLRRAGCVEIINHCPTMSVEELAEFSGTDLDGVATRYVPFHRKPYGEGGNLFRRYRQEQNWQADISAPYDLFINFAHWAPPFCHASVGVLIVLFPLFVPPDTWVGERPVIRRARPIRKCLRDLYYCWQWPRRLASYKIKLAISQFTQSWTNDWWGISCPILYPPVDSEVERVEKSKTILSVGRFTPSETIDSKKQLELVRAFSGMPQAREAGWQFTCAGRVSDVPVDQFYFDMVQSLGKSCGAEAMSNVPRTTINQLLGESAIFWHATGLGTSVDTEPYAAEHFGISTAEAMAAGCVPVVINRGGPRELIQHGVNGFLWNDLQELKDLTQLLIRDERLRNHMSQAARLRGQDFCRSRFQHEFRKHVAPFVPGLVPMETKTPIA